MTDELYTLYLDTFTMKLAGVNGDEIWEAIPSTPTMQERAVIALALAGAGRPSPALVPRENLAKDLCLLLEVK